MGENCCLQEPQGCPCTRTLQAGGLIPWERECDGIQGRALCIMQNSPSVFSRG